MEDITLRFSIIEDPQHSGYATHKLEDVLTIAMCTVLRGLERLENFWKIYETAVGAGIWGLQNRRNVIE